MPDELLDHLDVVAREAMWCRMLSGEATNAWLANIRENTVGFVAIGPARTEAEPVDVGEIYAIYLDRAAVGCGIGRSLLEQATVGLRERGFHAAMLWVLEANTKARRFYEAAGWSRDGAEKCEPLGAHAVRELMYRINLKPL